MINTKANEFIGKTTHKSYNTKNESLLVKTLRNEKWNAKKAFQNEKYSDEKIKLKHIYIKTQSDLRAQIKQEEEEMIEKRISKMCEHGSNGFWKKIKRLKKDEFSQWSCIKDEEGNRIFDLNLQKERLARYYEDLYTFDDTLEKHPHHNYIKIKIKEYRPLSRYRAREKC